jgi:SHS2 domain-containing protein
MEQAGYSLYSCMTELGAISHVLDVRFSVSGTDLPDLLFNFMDELLYRFNVDPYIVAGHIAISDLGQGVDGNWNLQCSLQGESFDRRRHPCGTEVKAITGSNLQISNHPPYHIYVIFDI